MARKPRRKKQRGVAARSKKTAAQLDRDIAEVLSHRGRRRNHATKIITLPPVYLRTMRP